MYELISVDKLLSWVSIYPVSQSVVWVETRTEGEKCLRTGLDFSYIDFGGWNSLKSNG